MIVSRRPMLYRGGAREAYDQPAHVRAGSGVVYFGPGLAVVQDDTNIVGLVDPASGLAEALLLPSEGGVRQFGTARGNKQKKLDFESALTLSSGELVAFGSGSTAARFRVLRARPGGSLRVFEAPTLYRAMLEDPSFSGSELNLEGAARVGDRVYLFQRGNGAPRGDLTAVNATAWVSAAALEAALDADEAGRDAAPIALCDVTTWELGDVAGVPLTFTDATAHPDGVSLVWLGAAEASPDTYNDGACVGAAVGFLDAERAFFAPLEDAEGRPVALKCEGLVVDRDDPSRVWVVVDRDDPSVPSELLAVQLDWPKVT